MSSNFVLPVSTWPKMQQIGDRRSSLSLAAKAAATLCFFRSAISAFRFCSATTTAETFSSSEEESSSLSSSEPESSESDSDSDSDSDSSSELDSSIGVERGVALPLTGAFEDGGLGASFVEDLTA